MSIPPASGPQRPEHVSAVSVPVQYGPPQLVPPRNGAATASLVLGIVSIVTSLLFVPAIVGVILGIVGVARAGRTTPPVGKGRAVAGIVLSVIGLLVGIGIVSALAGGDDTEAGGAPSAVVQDQGTDGESGALAPTKEPEPAKEPAAAGVGDPVRDGKFEFTVTRIEPGVGQIGDEFFGQEAQGQFVLVHLTVENIGDESQYFDGNNVTGYDAKGREFAADTEAAIYLDDSNSFLNEINPGNVVEGVVVFDVPADVELSRLELHDSYFSGGAEVALD